MVLSDHKGNYNTFIGYNEELAHLIYAGSDFLLMPSRGTLWFEPNVFSAMEQFPCEKNGITRYRY
jgi:glycogen synthase